MQHTKQHSKPMISVIIPVYKGEKTIAAALQSVIGQTLFLQCEVLVLDDASPDRSADTIGQLATFHPNIYYHRSETNQGITKTHNWGLSLSRGTFIARIDQDDVWIDQEKLKKQVQFLRNNPKVGLVGTWAKVKNSDGPDFDQKPPIEDGAIRAKMLLANMIMAPSVLFRRELVRKWGTYDETLKHGVEDYELWLRIGTHAHLANLPEFTLQYSFNPSSYSYKNKAEALREHLQTIRRYRNHYPHYRKALIKNMVEYQMLQYRPLRILGQKLAPYLAKKIYA